MMSSQIYQLYQAERPKTAAEIRRADDQLGRQAESLSRLWRGATRLIRVARPRSHPRRADACQPHDSGLAVAAGERR